MPSRKRTRKPSRKIIEAAHATIAVHWTKEEHDLFLQGIDRFGKGNWKEIASLIQTRTNSQVRSHAQTYYNKIRQQQKQEVVGENSDTTTAIAAAALVELNTTATVTKKRKVTPFAIPTRGDANVRVSEVLIPVAATTKPAALTTVSTRKPPPKKRVALVPIQQQQQKQTQPVSESKTTRHFKSRNLWTQEEDVLLKQYYEQGLKSYEISKKLPHRSTESCFARLSWLGFGDGKRSQAIRPWTQEEDALLKQYYEQGLTYHEISKKLPHRSVAACQSRGNRKLGGASNHRPSCSAREAKLGFGGDRRGSKWTQEEDLLLKQYYEQGLKYDEIAALLPYRSAVACEYRLYFLDVAAPNLSKQADEVSIVLKNDQPFS